MTIHRRSARGIVSKKALANHAIRDAQTYLRARDVGGALAACLRHAEELGLDRDALWNTFEDGYGQTAVDLALRSLAKV